MVNRLLKFHPICISRLFTNAHGTSPLGQYCIWLYHKQINQFLPVYINDSVPFYQPDPMEFQFTMPRRLKTPVYAPVTNENSIWFLLLEKALAKVVGSYYALQETPIADIFSMLTGCPVVNVENITEQKVGRIFGERVFSNKKAYVLGLRRCQGGTMRIDRVVGVVDKEEEDKGNRRDKEKDREKS